MTTITFDTLAYSENMQKAGFTREQADAMAKINAKAFKDMVATQQLATKQDVNLVKQELAATKHDLEIAIAAVKHDILKWMVTGMLAQTALLVGILAFLK